MLNKPTVAELLEKGNNRYTLVIATAKRARQIAKKREEMVKAQQPLPKFSEDEVSPITAAANEIYDDNLKIYNEQQWKQIEEERAEAKKIEDEKAQHFEEIKMQALASAQAMAQNTAPVEEPKAEENEAEETGVEE